MKRKMKYIAVVLVCLLLAALLTACQQPEPEHPIIAKWAQEYDGGDTKIMFSFEAIGDAEVCVWRRDEAGELKQSEYYRGTYALDEAAGTIALSLRDEDENVHSATVKYALGENEITLTTDEHELTLPFAAKNSGRTK